MPVTIISDNPKTVFHKLLLDTLNESFIAPGVYHTVTFDAALVASNVINGTVGTAAITAVTYATDSDTTMQAVATAIEAMEGVLKADVVLVAAGTTNDRVINVFPVDQTNGIALSGFAVTAGASQAGITIATVDRRIRRGMPVELDSTNDEYVIPATTATNDLTCIGIALADAEADERVSIQTRSSGIVFCKSSGATVPGPVKWSSYSAADGYNVVTDDTVTVANQYGWAIESAADGGILRVLVKH